MLTRREQFAMAAMQGIIAGQPNGQLNPVNVAYWAATTADALIAELDQTATNPEPDADGWIKWEGGGCPVGSGAFVKVKLRDGLVGPRRAGSFDWTITDDPGDIIAYRIVEDGK